MTKLNWDKAKRLKPAGPSYRAWMAKHGATRSTDEQITIVQGADNPNNKTGERIVHTFANLKAAHKAGFTWAI